MNIVPFTSFHLFSIISIVFWIGLVYAGVMVLRYMKRMASAQESIERHLQEIASRMQNR